ncbi:MAG TPA: NAD-dependent epimerase/dehydratase family protein [Sneathiellales bacterium]|nr:NAD-dependent epimerase/dehydratase family protein [Sneathiellales bacterium]
MKALVTGATGFVGSAVARHLVRAGHHVKVLARPEGNRSNLADLDVEISEGDLNDIDSLEHACAHCDALFHVAADYRLWTRHPAAMRDTNVQGTRRLMRAAMGANIQRIVYTSSVATLGILPGTAVSDEDTPVAYDQMIGVYKQSKFMAEVEVSKMITEDGLPAIIVNPSTPVGSHDIKPTPTGRMIVEAASGKMPAFVDTGLNIVHVDDVAEGHLLAFQHGEIGARYVLGGEDMTLQQILAQIAEITGRTAPKIRIPHNVVLPIAYMAEAWTRMTGGEEPFVTVDGVRMAKKKMYFSSERAKSILGYNPRLPRAAFEEAITWFGNNGYIC